jgi:signal recognition particle subunit SRP54
MQAELAKLDPKALEQLPAELKEQVANASGAGSLPGLGRGLAGLGGLPKGLPGLGGGMPKFPGLPGKKR